MIRLSAMLAVLSMCVSCQAAVGVRLLLGLTDQESAKWDGSVTARGATITLVEPWRFEGSDEIAGTSWRCSTHRMRVFGGAAAAALNNAYVANGVIVTLSNESDNVELDVKTAQGNFTVRLADIPYGKMAKALGGRVMADRTPVTHRITNTPEEEDYPAAATDKSGNVWLAYIQFKHHSDHNRLRANMNEPLTDFARLQSPTGGDQVFLRKIADGNPGEPIAVTEPGGDLYRPAVAVDGTGRVWVFWSQNEKGNFDLFARPVADGQAGATIQLSKDAGSDIDPAAATDSTGKVWVAWQGWRNGKASIFAAAQNGNGFTAPALVSASAGNEWNPAIAADSAGGVTVAWDSYRNGNYDIFMRTATNGAWGKESPVAATLRYEAYPSLAYGGDGRLWVAYEEGGEGWGKDFGAYETTGLAVYQGRAIRLIGFEKDGRAVKTPADAGGVLPGGATQASPLFRVDATSRQNDSDAWLMPNPSNAKTREPTRPATNVTAPRNTLPRLYADASGRIWLVFRSAFPTWWNALGTVWTEFVATYDGNTWTGPIYLGHSDNILDNRPALVSRRGGELMAIGSSDGRRDFQRIEQSSTPLGMDPSVARDPYNNDLFANAIAIAPASGTMQVAEAARPRIAGPTPDVKAERATIAAMRAYRKNGARLLRGEFHRHSEISMDGGSDGTLLDQWRYIIDAGALDWVGCCDHDNGGGREYSWWYEQKLTDIFYTPGKFVPMFSYERSVVYPEGHRNLIFAQRGIRTLPRLLPVTSPDKAQHAPDTQMLYAYLKHFNGISASHTSGTNMGTDWRDNDPLGEPAVEIYQGDRQNYEMPGAPRTNTEKDSIGGWRPKGFVSLALEMGYKLAFEASSDHVSTHMSYGILYASDATRVAVLEAFQKRRLYASTDNILADVRSGEHMLGEAFSTSTIPALQVKLEGTAPFAKVTIVKDNQSVYATEPKKAKVSFSWRDTAATAGKTSYYYVRGEQQDGEIVWVSPMWITYNGK